MANWADIDDLKSPLFLKLKDTDSTRDASLELLGEFVTAQMLSYMDNPTTVDPEDPQVDLLKACLRQCTYEWKQRATPGLQSVQMQDGSINKYATSEWLPDVELIMKRYRRFALYETN